MLARIVARAAGLAMAVGVVVSMATFEGSTTEVLAAPTIPPCLLCPDPGFNPN